MEGPFDLTDSYHVSKNIETTTDSLKAEVFNAIGQETMKLKQNFQDLLPQNIQAAQSEEILNVISSNLDDVINSKLRNFKTALDGCMQELLNPVQQQLNNLAQQITQSGSQNRQLDVLSSNINVELDKADALSTQLNTMLTQLEETKHQPEIESLKIEKTAQAGKIVVVVANISKPAVLCVTSFPNRSLAPGQLTQIFTADL